jgi:hypothetical protein
MTDIINKIEQPVVVEPAVERPDVGRVEKAPEQFAEKQAEVPAEPAVTPVSLPTVEPVSTPVEPVVKKIEDILSDGLDDFYLHLPPEQQQQFKREGEEAARKISVLLQQAKIKIKEIIAVIVGWLKAVPGLNKFFVEQSAKIKADKILFSTGKDKKVED